MNLWLDRHAKYLERKGQAETAIQNVDTLLRCLSLTRADLKKHAAKTPSAAEQIEGRIAQCESLGRWLGTMKSSLEHALTQTDGTEDLATLVRAMDRELSTLCRLFGLKERPAFKLFYDHLIKTSTASEWIGKALEKDMVMMGRPLVHSLKAMPAPKSKPKAQEGKRGLRELDPGLADYGGAPMENFVNVSSPSDKEALDSELLDIYLEEDPKPEPVQYSLLAPKRIEKGEGFLLDFYMYEKGFEDAVKEAFALSEGALQRKDSGTSVAAKGSEVTIRLYSPFLPSLSDEDTFVWLGGYHASQLMGTLPEDYPGNTLFLCVDVLVYGMKATTLKCVVQLDAKVQTQSFLRVDIKKAFFSYSSKDRDVVLTMKQGMEGLCPDVECYVDFLFLRGGQRWLEEVHRKIDESDALFLIWSENAYKSKWVKEEWTYALNTKGIDFIHPLAIEAVDPEKCPVPEALDSIHFGNVNALLRGK